MKLQVSFFLLLTSVSNSFLNVICLPLTLYLLLIPVLFFFIRKRFAHTLVHVSHTHAIPALMYFNTVRVYIYIWSILFTYRLALVVANFSESQFERFKLPNILLQKKRETETRSYKSIQHIILARHLPGNFFFHRYIVFI